MGRSDHRVRRDTAGVGPDPSFAGQLLRMKEVRDFKIADGEPDIRGWEVRTLAGGEIGEVDDLLIDPHRGEVVMLDIDLKDSDQHISVPIRGVQLDRSRNCVVVDSGDIRAARESVMGDFAGSDAGTLSDARAADVRGDNDREEETRRDVRYGRTSDDVDEVVIDSRPVIEEVVVRRRVVDTTNEAEEER